MAIPFYQDIVLGERHSDAGPFLERASRGRRLARASGDPSHPDGHCATWPGKMICVPTLVLYDGLVFMSSHSLLLENLAEATKDYVSRAIARYESEGLERTVDYLQQSGQLGGGASTCS